MSGSIFIPKPDKFKAIILINNELGKKSKGHRAGEFGVWATNLTNPDFAEYANGCEAKGIRVTEKKQLFEAMKELMNYEGPTLLELITDVGLI